MIPLAAPPTPGPSPTYDPTVRRSDGGSVRALKDPKLASHLVLLAEAAARAEASGQPLTANSPQEVLPRELQGMLAARRLRLTDAGEVQVFVIVADASAGTRNALETLGTQIERVDEDANIVQAWVPAGRLRQIANLPSVRTVRLPDYAFVNAGSIQSEGDAVMNSDDVRTTFGVDGTAVTVGVISDGMAGLAASQGTGDLPAVDTATCNTFGGDPGAEGAEGTAMLEIVHDIAPGASLMFGNFGFATVLDFNAAVDCLAANADVVVDDIGWFGVGPYDGTSLVSANTAAALNGPGPIRGYYTSVGNGAISHYQESYVDSGFNITVPPAFINFWDAHEFDVMGGPKGTKHAGQVSAPADFNRFVLVPGGSASIILEWDDPWGSSANDYDLFFGVAPDIFVCSGDTQDGVGGNDFPVEGCGVQNPTGGDVAFDIFIGNYQGAAAPVTFDLFLVCSGCFNLGNGNRLDFNTSGSSVANQGDAGGSPASVVSVGAVRHSTPGTIEFFSSLGLTEDGRLKPDLVAPDGVSVTGAGGFPSTFFGTSAAAPHVAGVAALLLECSPAADRLTLRNLLLKNAVDLGAAGPDNVYGNGRIDALASATAAGCSAPVGGIAELPEVQEAPLPVPDSSGLSESVLAGIVAASAATLLGGTAWWVWRTRRANPAG